ncbi:cupin domain-containing protein [Coleofasciculus sp. G2-EDA-02]|uniref:cupin domain-containing protein n=1 Tax=Coleofasciculus sp. G2-EDA-02 TaxID=3069529 RepID=UPI0033048232
MIRSSDSIPQEKGHCGTIRKLVSQGPAKFIHLFVDNAQKHYHKKTTEYYYVLNGSGHISLDDDIQPIKKGDLIEIEPGVKHQAIEGELPLEILVIEVPPAIGDCYIVNE